MESRFDLHHQFYAIFLSIWASFLIRPSPFVMRYALWVLFTTSVLLYYMHRGFHTPESNLLVRLLDFHISTVGLSLFGGMGLFGFSIRLLPLGSRPTLEECLFLVAIVVFWILSVELTRVRADLERVREGWVWRR